MKTGLVLIMLEHAAGAQNAPTASRTWSFGPVNFSGLLDGYYRLNLNHPSAEANPLRNFDVRPGQPSLSMAELTLDQGADPQGFHVDFGFGKAFQIIHGAETAGVFRNIEQAFVSWKPPKSESLQLDFSKFVTRAGAEAVETNQNWNCSRSLLFAWRRNRGRYWNRYFAPKFASCSRQGVAGAACVPFSNLYFIFGVFCWRDAVRPECHPGPPGSPAGKNRKLQTAMSSMTHPPRP